MYLIIYKNVLYSFVYIIRETVKKFMLEIFTGGIRRSFPMLLWLTMNFIQGVAELEAQQTPTVLPLSESY